MVLTSTKQSTRYVPAITRWRQFTSSLLCRPDLRTDERIRSLLGDERQWRLVARLSAFDRQHLLNVHSRLVEAGYTDPDLLRAALLHDIGKADDNGRVVGTSHRIARVLLRRMHPALSQGVAARMPIAYGLFLAENHAALGAAAARRAGASERCCQLIEQHEGEIHSISDPTLAALIAADEGMPIP